VIDGLVCVDELITTETPAGLLRRAFLHSVLTDQAAALTGAGAVFSDGSRST